jgi:hypothetical protein
MRTLVFAALGAFPIIALVFFTGSKLDQAAQKPQPASMTLTTGSAKEWLEKETGQVAPAILRDTRNRPFGN